ANGAVFLNGAQGIIINGGSVGNISSVNLMLQRNGKEGIKVLDAAVPANDNVGSWNFVGTQFNNNSQSQTGAFSDVNDLCTAAHCGAAMHLDHPGMYGGDQSVDATGTGGTSGSSTTLTLSGAPTGTVNVGDGISYSGSPAGLYVTAYNSGTHVITMSAAETIAGGTSITITAPLPNYHIQTNSTAKVYVTAPGFGTGTNAVTGFTDDFILVNGDYSILAPYTMGLYGSGSGSTQVTYQSGYPVGTLDRHGNHITVSETVQWTSLNSITGNLIGQFL